MGLGKAKENLDDVARAGSTSLSSSCSTSKELEEAIGGPISSPAPKGESANSYNLQIFQRSLVHVRHHVFLLVSNLHIVTLN